MKIWEIYTLEDPRGGGIRYVGVTSVGVRRRLANHLRESVKGRCHRANWIRKLISDGVTPVVQVIQTGDGDGWGDAERYWIALYRDQGINLTNATDGGDGAWGHTVSPEARDVMRLARLGKPLSESTRAKLRAVQGGRKIAPWAVAKSAESHRGLKHTDEAKQRISAARKGKPGWKPTPETVAKRVTATKARRASEGYVDPRIGREMSPETKAKISIAKTGGHHTPEAKLKMSVSKSGILGQKHTPEMVQKRQAAIRATRSDPNYVDPRIGRALSPEHIQKAVAARRAGQVAKTERTP